MPLWVDKLLPDEVCFETYWVGHWSAFTYESRKETNLSFGIVGVRLNVIEGIALLPSYSGSRSATGIYVRLDMQ